MYVKASGRTEIIFSSLKIFKLSFSFFGYDSTVERKSPFDAQKAQIKPEEVFKMLNRKKLVAITLTACLALGALPAIAEETAQATPENTAVDALELGRHAKKPDRQRGQQPPQSRGQAPDQGKGNQGPHQKMNGQQPDNDQTPPEMPEGQQPTDGQTPPDMPQGQQPTDGQTPPDMPQGQQPTDGQTPPEMPDGQQPGPGGNDAPTEYAAATTLTEDSADGEFASTNGDENAVLVSGDTVTLSGATVSKTGDSDGESADFYGINATILATDGATLNVTDAIVTSDGAHANGVFSYGSGTTVNVSNTTITTTGNNSGGLMTTGGATLNAENATVSTAGNSSAAIRSDRGGGTVTVNGGSFETSGVGSPAIYSTADITVSDATLSASASEAVVIEGGNSVTLNGVDITGSNTTLNGQSTVNTNVLIYQSMSGDAADGNSTFTMNGGTMTAETGDMFHVTNVTTTIDLTGVTFVNAEDSATFLSATADSWGNSGSNGGNVTLNLSSQSVTGDIEVDAVSSVALNLADASDYTGAIKSEGSVTVTIAEGCTWTLTGDSAVSSFEGDLSSVNLNGYTLYIDGVAYTA